MQHEGPKQVEDVCVIHDSTSKSGMEMIEGGYPL